MNSLVRIARAAATQIKQMPSVRQRLAALGAKPFDMNVASMAGIPAKRAR